MGRERVFAGWVPAIGSGPESTGLYTARSAGQARGMCARHARDAGYDVRLPDVRVRRVPEFDKTGLIYTGASLACCPTPTPEAHDGE